MQDVPRNNIFFLGTVKTEGPSLLENVEGLPNAGIGLMNADQQG